MPLPSGDPSRSHSLGGACTAVGLLLVVLLISFPIPVQAAPVTGSAATDTTAAEGEKAAAEKGEKEANPKISIAMKDGGTIVIELYPDAAPQTVKRILDLVKEGFYDDCKFHRVESYLIQTGQRESELPPLEGEMFGQTLCHEEGMVGMARLVDDYDSATTQFYICKQRLLKLNCEYTLFGRVIEGMELVHKMKKGTKIEHVALVE